MAVFILLLLLSVSQGLPTVTENNNDVDVDTTCSHGSEVMGENPCNEKETVELLEEHGSMGRSGNSDADTSAGESLAEYNDAESSSIESFGRSGRKGKNKNKKKNKGKKTGKKFGSRGMFDRMPMKSKKSRKPSAFGSGGRRRGFPNRRDKMMHKPKGLHSQRMPMNKRMKQMMDRRNPFGLTILGAESGPQDHGPDHPPVYMDYYDPRYEEVYGSDMMSERAKKLMSKYKYHGECGARFESVKTIGRISSGYQLDINVAGFAEFPWMAAVLVKEDFHKPQVYGSATELVKFRDRARFRCGATIINEQHVVTAAHCVYGQKKDRLIIRAGEWNLMGSTGEMYPSIDRYVENIHMHRGYNPANYDRDIALIKLDRPIDFNFTPHIRPVCLPPLGSKPFDGHMKCYIAGWGEDVYKPNFGSNVLKIVSVTLNDDEDECRAKLYSAFADGIVDPEYNTDEDYQKCIVGTEGRDACVGDGGGAVVCPLDLGTDCGPYGCEYSEHYFMAGIISFGPPTCGDKEITMITDILPHMSWLQTLLNKY